MPSRRRLASALALALHCTSSAALAQEQETYEEERTQDVLDREGLVVADAPEGRRIAFVRIVRTDVFIEEDGGLLGWLTWANIFHWLTKEAVIERELLLAEGDEFEVALAEESERNLRSLGIFSYARVVPVQAEDPEEIGLLVSTRDIWSLRIEQSFQITGATIDNLLFQLTERNLFGLQKRGSVRFFLVPDVYQVGQIYSDRRLANGSLSLYESFDLIFNRDGGGLEGSSTFVVVRSPFYDLSQRFGFDVRARFTSEVERQIRNGAVVPYDIPETEDVEEIPQVWRERDIDASARVLYRRGERFKQTFGFGLLYQELSVEPNAETGLTAEQEPAFARDVLPRERRDFGPFLTYEIFTPTFETFENLGSQGVTENVRSGPLVSLSFTMPREALGADTDAATFAGVYGYILAEGGWLAEASITASARLEDGDVINQRLQTEVRGSTPMMWNALRLVWRFDWEGRRNDTTRTLVSLGGDSGLRGYVSQAFFATGGNRVRGNLEIRTAPLVVWSVHIGGALFYDFGTVYTSRDDVTFHHGVGIGVRVMFPQFNELPFRFDVGAPASEGDGFTAVPSFGGLQAVPLTEFEDLQELQ